MAYQCLELIPLLLIWLAPGLTSGVNKARLAHSCAHVTCRYFSIHCQNFLQVVHKSYSRTETSPVVGIKHIFPQCSDVGPRPLHIPLSQVYGLHSSLTAGNAAPSPQWLQPHDNPSRHLIQVFKKQFDTPCSDMELPAHLQLRIKLLFGFLSCSSFWDPRH